MKSVRGLVSSVSSFASSVVGVSPPLSRLREQVSVGHPCRAEAQQFEMSCHCIEMSLNNQLSECATRLADPNTAAPFHLRAAPSDVVSKISGRMELGLFLLGQAPAGSLITLYPGTLYLPGGDPVLLCSVLNRFLLVLNNGITLDGRDSPSLSSFIFSSAASRDAYIRPFDRTWLTYRRQVIAALKAHSGSAPLAIGSLPAPLNPLGLGHFANHFVPLGYPNLTYISFNVPLSFPSSLSRYLPNVYWSSEHFSQATHLVTCVGLVAMRDVKDEELFVDYGFVGAAQE